LPAAGTSGILGIFIEACKEKAKITVLSKKKHSMDKKTVMIQKNIGKGARYS